MRRLIILLVIAMAAMPLLAADPAKHGDETAVSAGAEKEAHKVAHPDEAHGGGAGHAPKTYFGMPGWLLKLLNMLLFIGLLFYFLRKPVASALVSRREQIRKDAEEAAARRAKADQLASDIQARLTQIEQEVVAIRQRAEAEGERQKRELIAAAEAEAAKILAVARNEVDNRLKHARQELTEFAGQLAAERAETILRNNINDADRKKLFQESLRDVNEVS